jgi:hypothetical protein
VLLENLRRPGLAGTDLARAQRAMLRVRLLKIGAVALCNTQRIRVLLPEAYPWQDLFWRAAKGFASG